MNASGHHGGSPELARAMASVAREFFGEPTEEKPAKNELRFRNRGSLAVDVKAGTYFDHEAGKGGGVIALVREFKGLDEEGAAAWLVERGHLPKPTGGLNIVASYPYTDAAGRVLYEVVRLDPKDFRQRRPDASARDGWVWNMKGVQRVPYRLPELLAAIDAGEVV